ncbi:MAG TPA: SGNH/GDSL hydrolase family protein [Polyangiaceae bacterium]|nr:SGNH/GDSL hydrolase family protein [Polyangiaceae bacterium]
MNKTNASSRPPLQYLLHLALTLGLLLVSGEALANTLTQNTSWTIDRSTSSTKYRVVAYGDSIFAGYQGSLSNVSRRAAPWVQGEYLSNAWGTDIEVIRRTKSGAKADDIYNNKIVAERSHMQSANTRVVTFEMCGNDFLQARSAFSDQTGTCNFAPIDNALAACTTYQELAMQAINQYANPAARKMIMNLYYPGYDADNVLTNCTVGGVRINKQSAFLPRLARSNYRACAFAQQYGFACVDAFADWMGADYDSNGDGQVDSEALRWSPLETEDQYVARISQALRGTIRDANAHFVNASTSFDYLLSDNTHPTFSGPTVYVGLFGGTGSGTSAPTYSGSQIVNGRNPIFNQFGHERAGWASSLFNPASP